MRCTYSSDERWEAYLAALKGYVQQDLERQDASILGDWLAWTVLEDCETMDGLHPLESAPIFEKWLAKNGEAEIQQSTLSNSSRRQGNWPFGVHNPR